MTGGFATGRRSTHERAVLELDDGTRLAYRDVRRFGTWLVLEGAELEPYLAAKTGRSRSAALHVGLARRRSSLEGRPP